MNRIIQYILRMLPFMLASLPFFAVWRVIAIRWMKLRGIRTSAYHEAGIAVFALFLVGLASQTIFSELEFTRNGIGIIRETAANRVNLIPFKVLWETYTAVFRNHNIGYFVINFLGNIGMFIPIGFALPILFNKGTFFKSVLAGCCISTFIEISQLPLARGTDIDDVLLNTFGAFLGYCLYALLNRFACRFLQKFKVKHPENEEESKNDSKNYHDGQTSLS